MPRNTRRYFEELGELPDEKYGGATEKRGRGPNSREFLPIVKSKIGRPFERLVTPALAAVSQHYGTATSNAFDALGGANFAPWVKADEIKRSLESRLMELDPRGVLPSARIFGIGKSADPNTWAHEYRHERFRDEQINRVADAVFHATSMPAYRNALREFNQYQMLLALNSGNAWEAARLKNLAKDEAALEREVLARLSSPETINIIADNLWGENLPKTSANRERALAGTGKDFIHRNVFRNRQKIDPATFSADELQLRAHFPLLNFVGLLQPDATSNELMNAKIQQMIPPAAKTTQKNTLPIGIPRRVNRLAPAPQNALRP